jgi:hypothetical protein
MSEDSRWIAESKTGRFSIDRTADGGLMIVDYAMVDPDDEDSLDGMLPILPEEAEEFLGMMRKAVKLDQKEDSRELRIKGE